VKALVIIQGINDKPKYMLEDLSGILVKYDYVYYAQTERYFEVVKDNLPVYLRWLPLHIKDYAADIWGYLNNRYVAGMINAEITNEILSLITQGYEVDVIGHSLGTLITLCLGSNDRSIELNTFYCLNSPIGIGAKTLRLYIKSYLFFRRRCVKFANIFNIYGTDDFISKEMANADKLLAKRTENVISIARKGGHSHVDSIKIIEKI
jgi:hypothetical protein